MKARDGGKSTNNDAASRERTVLRRSSSSSGGGTGPAAGCIIWNTDALACGRDLERGEFLDYFRDGVNGLGIREQAVGDGGDDVKGALQELPRVGAIQLPGAEHALDAVPTVGGNTYTERKHRSFTYRKILKNKLNK